MSLHTAFHEAGHAFGYVMERRPIISLHVDGDNGRVVVPPTLIRATDKAVIAAMGPIAEAMYTVVAEDDGVHCEDDPFAFDDHLTVAIFSGGHQDYADAKALLDCRPWREVYRQLLTDAWDDVTVLALALAERGTVSGPEAERLLHAERYR